MAKLGSFGAVVREIASDRERDTFDFLDEEFTVVGVIPNIVTMKICAGMVGGLSTIEQDAAVYEALRHALTAPSAEPGGRPDRSQWERFYRLAADRDGHEDDLTRIVFAVMGAQAGFPTVPSPTSAAGSPSTGQSSSSSASDSQDSSHLVPVATLLGG